MKRLFAFIYVFIIAVSCFAVSSSAAAVPASYSSVDMGYVTEPKHQGDSGSCWAFAAVSALETDAIMKGYGTKNDIDFSEAHLVWSIYSNSNSDNDINKNEYTVPDNCNIYLSSGEYIRVINTLSKGCGINNESDFPFYPYQLEMMGNYGKNNYYVNNGLAVDEVAALDTDQVKEWILAHGSTTAMMYLDENKFNKNTAAYFSVTEHEVDHGVTVVGWDDNFSRYNFSTQPSSDGAWLVKNSWGTEWGDNGYFWVSYEDPSFGTFYGFTVKKVNYDNIYTYNGVGYSLATIGKCKIAFSNIFDINSDEILKTVSFYCIDDNLTADIRVVKLNEGFASPEDGTVVFEDNYIPEYKGYQTVETGNVTLSAGSKYSVIITLFGEKCCCVSEAGVPNIYKYTVKQGQSYIRSASGWKDCSDKGNVYINIYTANTKTALNKAERPDAQNIYYENVAPVTVKEEPAAKPEINTSAFENTEPETAEEHDIEQPEEENTNFIVKAVIRIIVFIGAVISFILGLIKF